MSEVTEISADQATLNDLLEEYLRQAGVEAQNGDPQAYMEFVRYDSEDKSKGQMIRLRYITLTNGGIKAEGEMCPRFSLTPAAAIQSYLQSLSWYLGGMKHILWRRRPELEQHPEEQDKWVVYSRLAAYT